MATLTISDIGGSADYPQMSVADAIEKLRVESARYPRSMFSVTFDDCARCGGDGWSESGHCRECDERVEELQSLAKAA